MNQTKICSKCNEEKELTKFHKQLKGRLGRKSQCITCRKLARTEHYRKNRARLQEERKAYRAVHRIKLNKASQQWREKNLERARESSRQWKKKQKGHTNSINAKRRAAKIQRTPAWADMGLIREVYIFAKEKEEIMGISMHVDHRVPLRGELVSGLHVHENLQVIPASANYSKNNAYTI